MVTINASTTSGLVMTSDLSGNLQFQNNGVNLPMGGVAPAFSAYQSSAQTLSGATLTKIQFQTEEWDTNNNFDSTTNYRFTPTVAGYYQVQGKIQPSASYTAGIVAIYKNGAVYKYGSYNANATGVAQPSMSCLVYCNGSTDYVEFYASVTTGQILDATAPMTWFQGCLVRGA